MFDSNGDAPMTPRAKSLCASKEKLTPILEQDIKVMPFNWTRFIMRSLHGVVLCNTFTILLMISILSIPPTVSSSLNSFAFSLGECICLCMPMLFCTIVSLFIFTAHICYIGLPRLATLVKFIYLKIIRQ